MGDGSDETFVGGSASASPTIEVTAAAGDKTEIVIGRDPDCDVIIDDARISRRHARLKITPGGVWLKDLGSRLGTRVNGQRIESSVRLRDGDEVVLGAVVVRTSDEPWRGFIDRATDLEAQNTGQVVLPPVAAKAAVVRRRKRRWLVPVAAAALLLLCAIGAGGLVMYRAQAPRGREYRAAFSAVFMIAAESNGDRLPLGTGFVVDGYPWIITNFHVADAMRNACMQRQPCHGIAIHNEAPNERFDIINVLPHPEVFHASDPLYRPDMALLKVGNPAQLPPGIPLADDSVLSADALRGEQVAIISFPGETMNVSQPIATIDFGTIGRVTEGQYIQHSANMTPGSSGSPLLIAGPKLAGINFAAMGLKPVMAMNQHTQEMGVERIAQAGGLNLAVSAATLRAFLQSIPADQ